MRGSPDEVERETTGYEAAPFGKRLAAGFIDLLVMAASVPVASVIAGVLVGWFYELARSPEIDVKGIDLVVSVAPIVAGVVLASYEPAWMARMGRTPGKAAMGLWVAMDDGGPVPLNVAFARGLLKILSVLPLGLGVWNAALDSRRKTWHDLFVGTVVTATHPVGELKESPTRAVPPGFMHPAHPARRLVARAIDALLLLTAALVVLTAAQEIAAAGTDPETGGVRDIYSAAVGLIYGAFLVAVALYEIAFIALRGQTLGKMAMGVRIVGLDGGLPGWGAASLRWATTIGIVLIPYIGPFIAGFIFLWVAWDRNGQGLHDKLAGTRAVAEEPGIRIMGAPHLEAQNPEKG